MRDLLENKYSTSGNDPIVAHLAQIRLLCSKHSLVTILREEHSISKAAAEKLSKQVAPFIEQALAYFDTATQAPLSVKPVIQYYSYLNFASAIVRIYQPPEWQSFKNHGVEDLTKSMNKLGLNTKVVKIHKGVVPLFHKLFSDEPLNGEKLSLKTLFSAIPMVSIELTQFFNQSIILIDVVQSVKRIGNCYRSSITYNIPDETPSQLPIRKIFRAIPSLRTDYRLHKSNNQLRTYISKKKWSINNQKRAEYYHNTQVLKMINYGSHEINPLDGKIKLGWSYNPQTRILPVLTASLILSFALSSLSRYRANLLSRSENTRLISMFEVFVNEADYFMIPAFRNLLYGHNLHVTRRVYI